MAGPSRACASISNSVRNDEELSKASALRELEKARVRECQMEKTVRWWTVCTAGWRKKWSKLRQENEELRKQIKTYKIQVSEITQDFAASNSKLEFLHTQNQYLKSEINKLLSKYGDEPDKQVQEILNLSDVLNLKPYVCLDCKNNKSERSNDEKTVITPLEENPIYDNDDKHQTDSGNNESKNVEVLTEMISKIFTELQNLKGEFVKQNEEELDVKEFSNLPISSDQICQLKIYALSKQLEKEKLEKRDILTKYEQANIEISALHNKIEEISNIDFLIDPETKIALEKVSLSDDE